VQSVAVRIICEREDEISKFVPEEYWNLVAQFEGSHPPPFEAKLLKIDGKKAKVVNGEQSAKLAAELRKVPLLSKSWRKKSSSVQPCRLSQPASYSRKPLAG